LHDVVQMSDTKIAAAQPFNEQLDRLAAFAPVPATVISLYLDLKPNERGRDEYEPFVRKVFAERLAQLEPRSPARASFEADIDRIMRYLRDEVRPSANGLAIFACHAAGEFFEALQLDAPVGQHWLFTGSVPHLYPLVRLFDRYPRYAAVLLDTHQTRIVVFGLNTMQQSATVTTEKSRRSQVGGWSQARYQRRMDNLRAQHVKEVVDVLDRLVTSEGISRIVIAGDEVSEPLLRQQLTPRLTDLIVDVIRLDRTTSEARLLEATLEALREKDAETDADRVAQMLDAWRSGGLAVAGPEGTLKALEMGQVDELLVTATPDTLRVPPGAGRDPLEISTSEGQRPRDGAKLSLADELVTRAQQTGARITVIEDQALLAPHGGVGALLRFRL
jgi:peptide chain release factor subunit 1